MATTYAIPDGRVAMAATLWTGNNATQSISNAVNGVSFQPDLVWVKDRSVARSNWLMDSVRGTLAYLSSNSTGSESNSATAVTALNTNGFSVGTDVNFNASTETYVGWQWKAGGTAVSNTAGSITSSVSANTTAWFSVVSFTGLNTGGTAATMGHGLGVAPSFIIIKNRGVVDGWYCYHASLGNTAYILLNTTAAQQTPTNLWTSTSPTSTVFTLRQGNLNTSTSENLIAYCFAPVAGYSAFGSYTGNGSSDGPFIYTGMRPRWILVRSTGSADWYTWDSSRNTYNLVADMLRPNIANAELNSSTYVFDFVSNGFKVRGAGSEINSSGVTYIYACFAENPFKYANAR